jgi:hypothetical protein
MFIERATLDTEILRRLLAVITALIHHYSPSDISKYVSFIRGQP